MKKALAEALNAFANARDFGDIDSGTNDHRNIVDR
jgi:hypothetical protein